jgi:hypothetical protein
MFTMDGRMRFDLNLGPVEQAQFNERKLQEIVLRSVGNQFTLSFSFSSGEVVCAEAGSLWPEYVVIRQDEVNQPMQAFSAPKQNVLDNSFGVSP